MEFDEIKNTWKDSFNKNEKLNSDQVEARLRLRSRSNTAIRKIKNSFKMELIAGAIMYIFIISALFYFIGSPEVLLFFIIITLLMGAPYYLYFKNYQKIKHVGYAENTLRQALFDTTNDIEKFVNIGAGSPLKIVMIPLASITGMIIGLFIGTGENDFIEILYSLEKKSIIKMIVVLVVTSGVLIPFSRLRFKQKFKQHYNELKRNLDELNEANNE